MSWQAFLSEIRHQGNIITMTIRFQNGDDTFTESYQFPAVPSEDELGILVHKRLTAIEKMEQDLTKHAHRIGKPIIPLDPPKPKIKKQCLTMKYVFDNGKQITLHTIEDNLKKEDLTEDLGRSKQEGTLIECIHGEHVVEI